MVHLDEIARVSGKKLALSLYNFLNSPADSNVLLEHPKLVHQ